MHIITEEKARKNGSNRIAQFVTQKQNKSQIILLFDA